MGMFYSRTGGVYFIDEVSWLWTSLLELVSHQGGQHFSGQSVKPLLKDDRFSSVSTTVEG